MIMREIAWTTALLVIMTFVIWISGYVTGCRDTHRTYEENTPNGDHHRLKGQRP